jgi:hypothetical protein
MSGLVTFFAGILTGLWVSAQAKVLHLPVFHLPKHIDPVAVMLCVLVALVAFSMRGKRTGGKP